jgi:hypothetical protein
MAPAKMGRKDTAVAEKQSPDIFIQIKIYG